MFLFQNNFSQSKQLLKLISGSITHLRKKKKKEEAKKKKQEKADRENEAALQRLRDIEHDLENRADYFDDSDDDDYFHDYYDDYDGLIDYSIVDPRNYDSDDPDRYMHMDMMMNPENYRDYWNDSDDSDFDIPGLLSDFGGGSSSGLSSINGVKQGSENGM